MKEVIKIEILFDEMAEQVFSFIKSFPQGWGSATFIKEQLNCSSSYLILQFR